MTYLPELSQQLATGRMTSLQGLTIVVVVYASLVLYAILFCLQMYNSYVYLWQKEKYKVFPVSLFYLISIPATLFRVYTNIWIVKICAYEENWSLMMPAILKLCIGIS